MALTPYLRAARSNRLILLALWLVFYASFTLFSPPLLDDADSVHAEVAREMLVRHDFVTLYANGIRYLEKAPLFYWAEAASIAMFGAKTAATRLPLAFAVLALTLLLEAFARRAFASLRAGLYAGLITLSSFGIFIFSRINIPDILVCFFLTAALFCYFVTETQDRPSLWLCCAFDACLALNILTKGLIGIVFPIGIVLIHMLLTRGWRGTLRRLLQFHPIASTATLLIIAVPWHILIAIANPGHGHPGALTHAGGHWQVPYPTDGNVHGWAWFYFINEQLYRYLNIRVPHDYDTSPLWLFLGLIFIWLMPWSAFLPSAIARAWPSSPGKDRPSGAARMTAVHFRSLDPIARTDFLLLIWAALPLLFFCFSTRQEYYVLPALPPMILLIAAYLSQSANPAVPHSIAELADIYLRDHLDDAVAEYCRRNTYGGTLAISPDAARELLPGYSTSPERAANTFVLSLASSRFAEAIWASARKVGPSPNRYIAVFLTGSPGSGKTSSSIEFEDEGPIAIISEGMMDNFDFSVRRIRHATDAGFVPALRLYYVDDPRTTIRRAVSRAMEFGRPVAIAHMARLYVDIPKMVAKLSEHFGENIGLSVFENSIDGRTAVRSTIDSALHLTGAYTADSAQEAMLDELDKLRDNGSISDELYRQFRDPAGSAGVAAPTYTAASRRGGRGESDARNGNPDRQDQPRRTGSGTVAAFLLILGTLISAALIFFLLHTAAPAPSTDLATLLQQNPADYALSFGHFLDLNARALGLFRLPLALTAIAFFFGPFAHFVLRQRNQPHAATLALAAASFVFLLAAHQGLVIFSPTITSYQLAEAIRPQLHPQDLIAIHGEYEAGSTLGFYLRRNDIHIIEGRSSNLWYGSFFPDAPKIFDSPADIARMWQGPQRIFLWQDPHDPDRPVLQLTPAYVIANSGGKEILSNQPNSRDP